MKRLDRLGLLGRRILDGLSLIDNHEPPRRGAEPWDARQGAVAGDDKIGFGQTVRSARFQLRGRHHGWMGSDGLQARCETRDLRRPVGEQRGWGHEQAWLWLGPSL